LATDADSGKNKELSFSSGDTDPLFEVRENGELWALKPLTEINQTYVFNLKVIFNLIQNTSSQKDKVKENFHFY